MAAPGDIFQISSAALDTLVSTEPRSNTCARQSPARRHVLQPMRSAKGHAITGQAMPCRESATKKFIARSAEREIDFFVLRNSDLFVLFRFVRFVLSPFKGVILNRRNVETERTNLPPNRTERNGTEWNETLEPTLMYTVVQRRRTAYNVETFNARLPFTQRHSSPTCIRTKYRRPQDLRAVNISALSDLRRMKKRLKIERPTNLNF